MRAQTNDQLSEFEINMTKERIAQSKHADMVATNNLLTAAKLWKKIPDATDENVIAIEKYKCLLERFLAAKCGHFATLDSAVDAVNEDTILVYITELQLYGTFTFDDYMSFVDNIVMNVKAPIEYTPKQITLSGFPQRVVFMCNNDEDTVTKIKEYCRLHFNSDIYMHDNGTSIEVIVQNPIVDNLEEAKKAYAQFVAFVNGKRKGANVLLGMKPLTIETVKTHDFVTNTIGEHLEYESKILVQNQLNGVPLKVNVNICNNGNQTINSNNNSNNGIVLNNEGVIAHNAKEWMRKNPPKSSELKSDYYSKYCKENQHCVSEVKFSRLVTDVLPCITKKSNGKNMWVFPSAKYTK